MKKKNIIIIASVVFVILFTSIILFYLRYNSSDSYVELSLNVEGANGDYLLLPISLDGNNDSIFNISDYSFSKGQGEITFYKHNGTKYLNISCHTDDVIIKMKRLEYDHGIPTLDGIKTIDPPILDCEKVGYVYFSGNHDIDLFYQLHYSNDGEFAVITISRQHINKGWNLMLVNLQTNIEK